MALLSTVSANHLILKYASALDLRSTIRVGFGNGTKNVANNSTYSHEYSYLARLGLVILKSNETCQSMKLADPSIIYCDESIEIKIDETNKNRTSINDPSFHKQWALQTIKVQNVWNTGDFGKNVLICVIDMCH